MGQYNQTFDFKINVGHCDLYFMVQWFCVISWRLFDICSSYFWIMNQYNPRFDQKLNVGHCDLYFMIQWFCFLSLRLFDVWTSLYGIMILYDPILTSNNCGSLWSIFHGPVILRYILKTIWCMNIILLDYESVWPEVWLQNKYMSLWPIFLGPVILRYILKTIFDI